MHGAAEAGFLQTGVRDGLALKAFHLFEGREEEEGWRQEEESRESR